MHVEIVLYIRLHYPHLIVIDVKPVLMKWCLHALVCDKYSHVLPSHLANKGALQLDTKSRSMSCHCSYCDMLTKN